ncbi:MAG: DnaJ domain-containing protein [Peptoniphilaceae bacterium]|nr:DnaJ domain-containing protein [Peptoniphilaceae bacterium]MDY6019264.1 DnaJ domain-containing protein [Anaerococcus sp.]
MKIIFGKILHAFATGLSYIINFLINLISLIVTIFEGIKQILFLIGCSFVFVFPIFFFALPNELIVLIFLTVAIPFLGTRFVSLLRYASYTLTEWMYDRADSLITGKKKGYDNLSDYSNRYKEEQERQRRRREEAERQRQQDEFNKRFEDFARGFRFYDFSDGSYGDFGSFGQGGYSTGENKAYGQRNIGFKEEYEKACDTLEVSYDADEYQIKLNYRKLAKMYHPDINKSPDATEKFQKINEAYEFLSKENINKYKQMYK